MTQEIIEIGTQPRQGQQIEMPDLSKLLLNKKQQSAADINCVSLGTIQSFDPITQTASISINYKRILLNQNNPLKPGLVTDLFIDYPLLVGCPIVSMSGGQSALTMPIEVGDTCIVLFNDRDIDAWFESGQVQLPPNSDRVHDLSDGIALVGIKCKPRALKNYNQNGPEIRNDKTSAAISVEEKLSLRVGDSSLLIALNFLLTTLISATITGGAFSALTIQELKQAQTLIDGVLQ